MRSRGCTRDSSTWSGHCGHDMSLRHYYLRIDGFVLTHERKVSVHTHRRPKLQLHGFFPYHRHLKFSVLSRDICGHLWSMYLCMFPVARCPLHCAAGRASMRAHLVICSSFQRASEYASLYGYLRFPPACYQAGQHENSCGHSRYPPPSGSDQTCSNFRRLRP